MSSLEEKLKRLSSELSAYRPQDDALGATDACTQGRSPDAAERRCLHIVTEYDAAEASGGFMAYASGEALRVLCGGGEFEGFSIEKAAFVDTETTGLGGSGTVAFLIGLGHVSGAKFVVEQYFMEDYDVEAEMLLRLCKKLEGFEWLVTFNGKCFDAPLIASRAVINRINTPLEDMEHIDLMHAARRIYKKRLRQCNLKNLEKEALGLERGEDIPGSLVPAMFFEYLRTGDFAPMEMVLGHNRSDVKSMLTLLCSLCRAITEPEALAHALDTLSCGRLNERMGRMDDAEKCYLLAGAGGEGARELSLVYKRSGRYVEAEELWLAMRGVRVHGAFAYEELAKHYERRVRDRARALEIVEEGMVQLRAWGLGSGSAQYDAFAQRRLRLMAKLDTGGK